jgi:hypothetical protein
MYGNDPGPQATAPRALLLSPPLLHAGALSKRRIPLYPLKQSLYSSPFSLSSHLAECLRLMCRTGCPARPPGLAACKNLKALALSDSSYSSYSLLSLLLSLQNTT